LNYKKLRWVTMTKPQLDDLEAVRKVIDALTGFDPAEQERIVRWAREKVGLPSEGQATSLGAARLSAGTLESAVQHPPRGSSDIKSFIAEKNPSTDAQFAATVAYYYRFDAPEHLRKESITADDLQEACRLVGRARLVRPAQTLVNTMAQGLLNRGERGAYTINTVGENLVAMALPGETGRVAPRKAKKKTSSKPRTGVAKSDRKASG
jgi:hypothetical protein